LRLELILAEYVLICVPLCLSTALRQRLPYGKLTLDVEFVGKHGSSGRRHESNVHRLGYLRREISAHAQMNFKQWTNLPCLNEDAHPAGHDNHPARVLIVVDEIK
jgi:hypothetical protein